MLTKTLSTDLHFNMKWFYRTFPLDKRVKMLQAFAYIGFIIGIITYFDWAWLAMGLAYSWLVFLIGAACGLHKYSSHRSFEPKNKFFKILMLFCSMTLSLGSNVSWACTHRKHHKFSDHEGDPHSPNIDGGGWWRSIRLWFYYFPTYHINPRTVKDLSVDAEHKWFHNHYFKLNLGWFLILFLISPKVATYFYFLPIIYAFQAISYITVLAHNRYLYEWIGYTNFPSKDLTFNSKIASVFVPGDGNHNNHHTQPGAAINKFTAKDWDFAWWFIRLAGKDIKAEGDFQQTHHT